MTKSITIKQKNYDKQYKNENMILKEDVYK